MTKAEFTNAVKDVLLKSYKYSEEKANKCINSQEAKAVIDDDYNYINDKSMAISPQATASTLDLMI